MMTENKTIRRWFWVWDFEKEEAWLNTMAEEGWVLDNVGCLTYTFKRCEPGEYSVRLECRGPEADYIDFMKETGAEYIGRMVQWIYFRKKTKDGPFNLFSDLDSRIKHLNRIAWGIALIGLANFAFSLVPSALSHLNCVAAILLAYCLGRIHGKREALLRDKLLQE